MLEAAQSGLVWDLETLSQFLTKPRKVVNGSFMNFTGLTNPDDVANVVAYLATFSPPPQ
jgi:cytochrome c